MHRLWRREALGLRLVQYYLGLNCGDQLGFPVQCMVLAKQLKSVPSLMITWYLIGSNPALAVDTGKCSSTPRVYIIGLPHTRSGRYLEREPRHTALISATRR